MLAIARALMMQPKLLDSRRADAGSGAGDSGAAVARRWSGCAKSTPITVLFGEQNVTFALPHADRVYVLEHARIVWEGDPARFAQEMGTGYL